MSLLFKTDAQKNAFEKFVRHFSLTAKQQEQFLLYLESLVTASAQFNLTTILEIEDIIEFHFRDSLQLTKYPIMAHKGIADIGTGAGFPGIPLKIYYPEIPMVLVEVCKKKTAYLQSVIDLLGLQNIEICDLDWRTFLRKTTYSIDLIVTRAALHPDELIRMFKPSCPYNQATLVYWASSKWQPTSLEKTYLKQEIPYAIKGKQREFAVFGPN